MVLHQDAAGALVGGIEVQERGREVDLTRRLPVRRVERALETAREPLVQGLTLHEEPQPERRVELLEPAQEGLGKTLAVEKERVHVPGFRRALFDRPHVDAEQRRAQADVVATDDEAGKADRFEQLPSWCKAWRREPRAFSSLDSLHNSPQSRSRVSRRPGA